MRIYREIVLFQATFAQILSNSKRAQNQALNISSLFVVLRIFIFMLCCLDAKYEGANKRIPFHHKNVICKICLFFSSFFIWMYLKWFLFCFICFMFVLRHWFWKWFWWRCQFGIQSICAFSVNAFWDFHNNNNNFRFFFLLECFRSSCRNEFCFHRRPVAVKSSFNRPYFIWLHFLCAFV